MGWFTGLLERIIWPSDWTADGRVQKGSAAIEFINLSSVDHVLLPCYLSWRQYRPWNPKLPWWWWNGWCHHLTVEGTLLVSAVRTRRLVKSRRPSSAATPVLADPLRHTAYEYTTSGLWWKVYRFFYNLVLFKKTRLAPRQSIFIFGPFARRYGLLR